jgi:hypothetical protein
MVQQPGCPNLYWALTDLPAPLVELRKGLQGACSQVAAELRPLRDDAPMTEAEVEELVSRLSGVLGFAREQAGQLPRSLRVRLTARVKDPERVRAARARLIEAGYTVDPGGMALLWQVLVRVGTFSPAQIILLDEKRAFEIRRDENMKLLALPPWQIDWVHAVEAGRGGDGLFADLLPDVIQDRQKQGRLERRLALLRHVEALRLYAATHDGKLPPTLAAVGVPLPADPFTGQPFVYAVEAETAHLRGTLPPDGEKGPGSQVRYEVAVRK